MASNAYDPEVLKRTWRVKLRLGQHATNRLHARQDHTDRIDELAKTSTPEFQPGLKLEVLSRTWTLVDNLFSVYELQAAGTDTLTRSGRESLMGAAKRRGPNPPRDFFERIWLYNALKEGLQTSQFQPKGITPAAYDRLLQPLLDRSITELQGRFQRQHEFLTTYEPIVMAHRHGRAVFPVTLTTHAGGMNLSRSPGSFTVFRGTKVLTLTMDAPYEHDLAFIRDLTRRDLKNISTFYAAADHLLNEFLGFLEHPTTEPYNGPWWWILFTQPQTEDERRVASAYQIGA